MATIGTQSDHAHIEQFSVRRNLPIRSRRRRCTVQGEKKWP